MENNKTENLIKCIEHWITAFTEMIVANITLAAFTDHVITLFWSAIMTIVIFFTNKALKRYFK